MLGIGLSATGAAMRPLRRSAAAAIQPIVLIGASNTAGGDDSAGAMLDAALDEDSRIFFFHPANGSIGLIDAATGIPRPGGMDTQSTTPAISFAKYLAGQDPALTYVVVPTAVGGRGVYNGAGATPGSGPWDPDGTGAAWNIGDATPQTEVSGALYKAHTSGNWKTALESAAAASFPGQEILPPVFFGHPCNENDTGGAWSDLADKAKRCVEGIRSAWGAATAPWVLYGGPPEWTYQGAPSREKIVAVNQYLAQVLPGVVFVEGLESNQHPAEGIHYNNAGYRLLGTKCGPAVAKARAQAAAPHEWVDWLDGLANLPQRAFGLYRWRAAYAGAAFRLHNGTTETDIGFDAGGYPDIAAIEAHAGSGTAWITRIYDQMGSGSTMVPEGTGQATLVLNGDILQQGKRLAWGDDSSNILLKDTSYTALPAGALLAVGRIKDAGNPVMLAGSQNTLAIYAEGGNLGYAPGSATEYNLGAPQEYEPSWLSTGSGHNLFANYVDSTGLYVGGTVQPQGTDDAFTYGSTGLAWGGRIGQTNRYSNGSHTGAFAWDVAPAGADLAAVHAWAKAVTRTDILDS